MLERRPVSGLRAHRQSRHPADRCTASRSDQRTGARRSRLPWPARYGRCLGRCRCPRASCMSGSAGCRPQDPATRFHQSEGRSAPADHREPARNGWRRCPRRRPPKGAAVMVQATGGQRFAEIGFAGALVRLDELTHQARKRWALHLSPPTCRPAASATRVAVGSGRCQRRATCRTAGGIAGRTGWRRLRYSGERRTLFTVLDSLEGDWAGHFGTGGAKGLASPVSRFRRRPSRLAGCRDRRGRPWR